MVATHLIRRDRVSLIPGHSEGPHHDSHLWCSPLACRGPSVSSTTCAIAHATRIIFGHGALAISSTARRQRNFQQEHDGSP